MYFYLYVVMLLNVVDWNLRKNVFLFSSVYYFFFGKEVGVNIRFRFNIYISVNVYGYYGKFILKFWFFFSIFVYCVLINKLGINYVWINVNY